MTGAHLVLRWCLKPVKLAEMRTLLLFILMADSLIGFLLLQLQQSPGSFFILLLLLAPLMLTVPTLTPVIRYHLRWTELAVN